VPDGIKFNNVCHAAGWVSHFLLAFAVLPFGAYAMSPGEKAYANGDYEKAENYFREKVQKDRKDYQNRYNLGNSLYQLKQYDESSEEYESSVENKSDFQYGWYNLGVALAKQQRYQDAMDAFQRALEINPNDQDAKRNLEIVKKMLKENPKHDRSRAGGKYKEFGKKEKSGESQATPENGMTPPLPKGTMPPPKKKDEKEDENSDKKRSDPQAKKKMETDKPTATPPANSAQKKQDQPGEKKVLDPKKLKAQQKARERAERQRREDVKRQEAAKKELKLSDEQVKKLFSNVQKQEQSAQQYYSPNPQKERRDQNDMWKFMSPQMRQFMKGFFENRSGEKDRVREDW
jgi:Ca-activated chloride channel homolog